MHIEAIRVINWRGLSSVALEGFSRSTFFVGLNGAGKSSLLMAVQQVLAGACYGQDGKRLKLNELIGRAGKDATIELDIALGDKNNNHATLRSVVNSKGQKLSAFLADGREWLAGSPDEVRAAFWKTLRINPKHAGVALNPRAHLLGDDLGKLLAELSDDVEPEKLKAWCGEHYDWLRGFLSARQQPLATAGDMTKVGKLADDARRDKNRDYKAGREELESVATVTLPKRKDTGEELTPDQEPSVQKQITTLRNKRDTLQRRIGRASAARTEQQIADDIKAGEAKLAELRAAAPDGEVVRAAQKALRDAETALSTLKHNVGNMRVRYEGLERSIKSVRDGHECPTCKRQFKPSEIKAMISPLTEELNALESEISGFDEQEKELFASLAPLRETAQGLTEEARLSDQHIAVAEERLAAARVEEPQGDVAAMEVECTALAASVTAGERVIQTLREYTRQQQLLASNEALYTEIEHLNWAIDAFRDGAAQHDLCGRGRTEFQERVNALLSRHGYRIDIEAQGSNCTVLLGRVDGQDMVGATQASDGELFLTEMAVSEAFAGTKGLAIADGADALDGQHKPEVFAALAESKCSWLIAGAWGLGHDPDFEQMAAALAPTTVVWVEGEDSQVRS